MKDRPNPLSCHDGTEQILIHLPGRRAARYLYSVPPPNTA